MADKEIRMLSEHTVNNVKVPAGRVAKLPEATAKALVKEGLADDNADAVAYAKTENAEVIDATVSVAPEEEPAAEQKPAA